MASKELGGWSGFSFTLTQEAKDAFKAALKGLTGVDYKALAFATQVVAGINYCYLCKGTVVYPGGPELAAKVYVYDPPNGDPHITGIEQITP